MNDQSIPIEKHFGHVASLIGEKSRALMLWSLLDGRAYTATELAIAADVSFQSASNHLSQLLTAGLLRSEKQGRHKYYRFANDRVAQAVENIAALVPIARPTASINHCDLIGVKYARTCYDHLAGKVGVQLNQSLLKNKWLILRDNQYEISKAGNDQFENIGIDISAVQKLHRKFAYPCLDWSERNHHLGGALGAALLQSMIRNNWIRRVKHTREILITAKGKAEISRILKTNV
ncbi:MAG: ArsR/SmtB family transcription factor [Chitinophagales bacterium]